MKASHERIEFVIGCVTVLYYWILYFCDPNSKFAAAMFATHCLTCGGWVCCPSQCTPHSKKFQLFTYYSLCLVGGGCCPSLFTRKSVKTSNFYVAIVCSQLLCPRETDWLCLFRFLFLPGCRSPGSSTLTGVGSKCQFCTESEILPCPCPFPGERSVTGCK